MKFSNRFKLLWTSILISETGDWLLKIALPLMIYKRTGSASQMATVFGISFLPWIFFSIIGGLLADRINRKRILITGNIISAGLVGILAWSLTIGAVNMILIYTLVFLQSSVEPLMHPATQSILPEIVDSSEIVQANSEIQMVDNTLNLIGPIVGGALAAFLSPDLSIIIDAFSFLSAGVLISPMIVKYERKSERQTVLADLKEGLIFSFQNTIVLDGSVLFFFTNFATYMFEANFMYFMTGTLKYSAFFAGITIAISGIGAVIGGLIAPQLNKYFSPGKIIVVTTIFAGLGLIAMFRATNFIYIGLAYGISNMCSNINVITYFSLRQKIVPNEILGRVVSITRMISFISIPLGSFLGAILSDIIFHYIWLF